MAARNTSVIGSYRVPTPLKERLAQFIEKESNHFSVQSEVLRMALHEFLEKHDVD